MSVSTVGFDSTTLVLLLVLALGGLGMKRGIRTEGITLGGVLGAVVIFGSDGMREELIGTINRVPRFLDMLMAPGTVAVAASKGGSAWFKTSDQRLAFYIVFFVISVMLFYYVGSKFGSQPMTRIERLIGGVLGAVGGFAIGFTMTGFGQYYLSSHPNLGRTTRTLASIETPPLPVGNALAQYVPLVFLVAFGAVAILALTSFRKAKQ